MPRGAGCKDISTSSSRDHEGVLRDIYREATEWLDDNYAFFLTHVLNIGHPTLDESIPTAAVASEEEGDDFEFLFNPDFLASLNPKEAGFVLAHETMHIVFNHLRLATEFDNHEMFNLSADAVINDYLNESGIEGLSGTVTGENLIGMNASRMTVREVYEILDKQVKDAGSESKIPEGFKDIDSHDWLHGADESMKEAADKIWQDIENSGIAPSELEDLRKEIDELEESGAFGSFAGKGEGSEQKFREEYGVSLAWSELLKEIDPDLFKGKNNKPPRVSYHQRRRKTASYEDMALPVARPQDKQDKKGDNKPFIVMALDTSGSIGRETANRFINLARSVPKDKIDLHCCTFTTNYRTLDLESPKFSSGGTSFSPIEEFIQKEIIPSKKTKGKYPRAVIVVTDGMASFDRRKVAVEHQSSWLWLLTGSSQPSWYKKSMFGKVKRLRDFIGSAKVGL